MKRIAVFIAASLLSFGAAAQQASDATVERLMAITKIEKMLDTMVGSMDQIMATAVKSATKDPLPEPQQRKLDAMLVKVKDAMKEEMSWARMKPQYMKLYKETFTEEELVGLLAFYESPAGQALLAKMPVLMQKSVAMSQEQIKSMVPRIRAAVEEAVVQAKAGQ